MLMNTHKWITNQIAGYLNLGRREADLLSEGAIIPDRTEDFPHHKGKIAEKLKDAIEARRLFLNDDDECFYYLGMTLHYIQDGWTLKPRTKDKHTQWETDIDELARNVIVIDHIEIKDSGIVLYPFTDKSTTLFDIHSFLSKYVACQSYGAKSCRALNYSWNMLENNIGKYALPSKTINTYVELGRTLASMIEAALLSYFKEKEELLSRERDLDFPYIPTLEIDVESQIGLNWFKLPPYLRGTGRLKSIRGVFGWVAYCSCYTDFEKVKMPRPKWSMPYIDLFFALLSSLGAAVAVLFPKEISPEDWVGLQLKASHDLIWKV